MTPRITRRGALTWLAGLGVTAGAVTAGLRWNLSPAGAPPASPLTPRRPAAGAEPADRSADSPFPNLQIDPAAIRAFERDYLTHRKRTLALDEWTDAVRAQFLLSTDFFRFDADESRRISYVGYYDPAVTPCNNPLARLE
jgi:hypothetical protein